MGKDGMVQEVRMFLLCAALISGARSRCVGDASFRCLLLDANGSAAVAVQELECALADPGLLPWALLLALPALDQGPATQESTQASANGLLPQVNQQ